MTKQQLADFALFGGEAVFDKIRSTSNLVPPDEDRFFDYAAGLYAAEGFEAGAARLEQLLEARLAAFHGSRHCIAVCSGFWGLVLAIQLLALPGRREVVMPSLTYRRLADVVAAAGLVPHFCEVDRTSLSISAATARPCINDQTALLLGVHPIVNCCDAAGLEALSAETGIPLMFDAVESVYEAIQERKVGSFGKIECFSMHASKLLNSFEGGYLTTHDDVLAEKLRLRRDLGVDMGRALRVESGMQARLSPSHAAMALAALDGVHDQIPRNRANYERYCQGLTGIAGLRLLNFQPGERHGYKNIVVELLADWPLSRDQTLSLLHAERMLCRPYYSPALHQKKASYEMVWSDLSFTEWASERFMLLPCGHFVSVEDVDRICAFLADVARHGQALAQALKEGQS